MKKSFLFLGLLAVAAFYSCTKEEQKKPVEEEQADVESDYKTMEENGGLKTLASPNNICCFTPATNIVRDPEFLSITAANLFGTSPCNNLKRHGVAGYNTNWFGTLGNGTPQVGVINCTTKPLSLGACNRGFVHFWGNAQFGEAITQDNQAVLAGKTYIVQFNARIKPSNIGDTRLALRLSNVIPSSNVRTASGPYSSIYTSPIIKDTIWRCYKFEFRDSSAYKVINLFPVNQFSGSGNFARLDIDDVKIW